MSDLHPIEASALHARRERVFLVLAGLFLGSMTMLNILGVSRFLDMSFELFGVRVPFVLAVGVLPYPITFLCTDFISELYGRSRASFVVWVGLLLNLWVVAFLWIGGVLPPEPALQAATGLPATDAYDYAFYRIRMLTMGAVLASMVAYLTAQLCDVFLFHFWKRLTNGRHLWLRNNGSTLVSQFVARSQSGRGSRTRYGAQTTRRMAQSAGRSLDLVGHAGRQWRKPGKLRHSLWQPHLG